MGEREGPELGNANCRVGMALVDAVGGGGAWSRRKQASEQGRAAGHVRRGATQLTGGAGRQQGPVVSGGV
jgi:hypothetical protein